MSPDSTPEPDDEVTLEELTAWRAGELSADQEERLRTRMARDPDTADKLWALDNVHRLFEKPPPAPELPADMPYDVAARLQARLAQEAVRRASEGPEGADAEDGLDYVDDDLEGPES